MWVVCACTHNFVSCDDHCQCVRLDSGLYGNDETEIEIEGGRERGGGERQRQRDR